MGSGRSKFQSNVQWMNTACDEYDDECAAIFRGQGLKVNRFRFTLLVLSSGIRFWFTVPVFCSGLKF